MNFTYDPLDFAIRGNMFMDDESLYEYKISGTHTLCIYQIHIHDKICHFQQFLRVKKMLYYKKYNYKLKNNNIEHHKFSIKKSMNILQILDELKH